MFKHLRDDIASIVRRDPAARTAWEVLTCYPGLHAVAMHRAAHWCWTHKLKWAGRFIAYLGRILTAIEIHPGAIIGRRVFIDHGFGVVIGETAEVGDDCTIYQGVTLGGTVLTQGAKRHPTLGRGVIVGAGAQLLGAFEVGDYAKVGSNSVVMAAVPSRATAVGNPSRIVGAEPAAHKAPVSVHLAASAIGTAARAPASLHDTQLRQLEMRIARLEAACDSSAEQEKAIA